MVGGAQEIVLYCGRLIGTNPDMFRGILKIRVGWVLEAIRVYLALFPAEAGGAAALEALSPYRLRSLLQRVLTVSDWADEKRYRRHTHTHVRVHLALSPYRLRSLLQR